MTGPQCAECGVGPATVANSYQNGRSAQRELICRWLRKRFDSRSLAKDIEAHEPEEWSRKQTEGPE